MVAQLKVGLVRMTSEALIEVDASPADALFPLSDKESFGLVGKDCPLPQTSPRFSVGRVPTPHDRPTV